MLKRFWADVWNRVMVTVISGVIIAILTSIYFSVKLKFDELTFWDTLLKTLISPYFLGLVILLLVSYILFDKLKKPKKIVLDWKDINHYIRIIVQKMKDDTFIPDWIIVSSERDVIVASMIIETLKEEGILAKSGGIPVSVPLITRKHSSQNEFYCESIKLTNDNWYIVIPQKLPIINAKNDKVLIVRDHSSTGICFSKMIEHLTKDEIGILENHIKTSCIARMVKVKFLSPNYFCLKTDDIWFPWGKSL